jgi:AhpD family alkylhydroperoxidase
MFISSTKQSSEINNSHYIDPLKPTVIVATPPDGWLGEPEVTARLMLTAKKIGWNVLSEYQIESIPLKELKNIFGIYVSGYVTNLDYPLYNRLPKSIPLFEIDFIVEKKASQDPEGYFNNKIRPKQVKAILGTSLQSIDCFINNNIQEQGLNFIMTWYPTVQSTHYTPNPTPKKLMYYGTKCPHDIRSNLKKYVQLWQQLDKTEYFVVYGFKFAWENMKKYQGYIPADGRSFVQTINKHGICLVMHRDTHLKAGAPSGRIFEAAAAAAVIISDKHPFVEKEFKNSVLYVDQTRDDLFEQIDTHMRWIKENPEAAKTKALQAHKIFLEKFTLEEQLIRLYENFKTIKLNT